MADIDGDGLADIVPAPRRSSYGGAAASSTGGLLFHKNLVASAAFSTILLDAGNYYDVRLVDVNLDGTLGASRWDGRRCARGSTASREPAGR